MRDHRARAAELPAKGDAVKQGSLVGDIERVRRTIPGGSPLRCCFNPTNPEYDEGIVVKAGSQAS